MRLVQKAIEVSERAEQRVHVAVVRDVVTEVGHWRGEEGRQPDRVHPEPDEVVELATDALEITDPVAVGIEERPRIDLVDDRRLPPRLSHGGERTRGDGLRSISGNPAHCYLE